MRQTRRLRLGAAKRDMIVVLAICAGLALAFLLYFQISGTTQNVKLTIQSIDNLQQTIDNMTQGGVRSYQTVDQSMLQSSMGMGGMTTYTNQAIQFTATGENRYDIIMPIDQNTCEKVKVQLLRRRQYVSVTCVNGILSYTYDDAAI